jgi:two-component system, NtrC family, nitrogen regulation sensor histidine kinase NtrY
MQFARIDKLNFILALAIGLSLLVGIVFSYRATIPKRQDVVAEIITTNLFRLLDQLDTYADELRVEGYSGNRTPRQQGTVDFLILHHQEIEYWTGNRFIPAVRMLTDEFEIKHVKTGSGDYLIRKWLLEHDRFLVAIIPLHIHYKIQNEYLVPFWNEDIFSGFKVDIVEANAAEGYSIERGTVLFRFTPQAVSRNTIEGTLAALFFLTSVVFYFILFIRITKTTGKNSPVRGFLLLAASVLTIRVLMIMFQVPARFLDTYLFDPKYFASSDLNPSIGDLVLNTFSIVILSLYLFRNYYRFPIIQVVSKNNNAQWLLSIFSSVALLFGALYPFVVIQTIYNNSAITLAISESIHFDALRVMAFCSVLFSWIAAFTFMHVFVRLLMMDRNNVRIVVSLLAGGILFILINESTGQVYGTTLLVGISYAVILIVSRLYKTLQFIRYQTFTYLFIGLIAVSLISVVAVTHFNASRIVQEKVRFASAFLIERDDFGEFLLNETTQKISNDLFIQTRLSGPFINRDAARQKIRQVFIPGYFNKYNVDILLFSATGDPLDDGVNDTLSEWFSNQESSLSRTSNDNVFFLNRMANEASKKYLAIIPVKRNDVHVATVGLQFSLKRIIPENVYPELLMDNRYQQSYRSQDFSYAVYVNQEIQFQSGSFNYLLLGTEELQKLQSPGEQIDHMGYRHSASLDPVGRMVVVSSPISSTIYWLADLSFLFVIGFGALLIYLFVVGLVDFIRHKQLMMSARIQLILNLSLFIPLIAVSVITVGLTSKSNQDQLNAEYKTKSKNFTNEVATLLNDLDGPTGFFSEQQFTQLAKMLNLDANYFTPDGRLQFTSQPLIFENQLMAPFCNPEVLHRIRKGESVFVTDEIIGELAYFVAYSALYSPKDGSLVGIIAIPFFQSAYLLEKMQITVLANIIAIFAAIFIVLLVISYWVSKWLTFPLHMITQKLSRISLTNSNQPLEWKSDDEIGMMVKEYNQMLSTLSESKKELERTQRERAWREIAQQVAHEIKNPLTPMKLTLQQLERLPADDPKRIEKFQKAVASILSQVDTLDGVASSFSAFATMPEPVMRETELMSLLKKVITLHKQSATIDFTAESEQVFIQADEQLLSRIFSNLLLNSIQASHPERVISIQVKVVRKDKFIQVSITDNGTGVEGALQDKIFLPHFSTKKSGSGLGLAIAKQGVEQMGGKIHFESKQGKGTTFYIELPMFFL